MSYDVGLYCEFLAMAEYVRNGYEVSVPAGNFRYDFIATKDGRSVKVQVKHGTLFNNGRELLGNTSRPYTRNDIDVLVIVDTLTEIKYYIPVEHIAGMTNIRIALFGAGSEKALPAYSYLRFIG